MNEILDTLHGAAHAVGYEVARVGDDGDSLMLVGIQEPWRPHRDDGQAFRLMVRSQTPPDIQMDMLQTEHAHEMYPLIADGFDADDEESFRAALRIAMVQTLAMAERGSQ